MLRLTVLWEAGIQRCGVRPAPSCGRCPSPRDGAGRTGPAVQLPGPPDPGAHAWPLVHAACVLVPVGTPAHGTRHAEWGGEGQAVLQRECATGHRERHAARALQPPMATEGFLAHVL